MFEDSHDKIYIVQIKPFCQLAPTAGYLLLGLNILTFSPKCDYPPIKPCHFPWFTPARHFRPKTQTHKSNSMEKQGLI